MKMEPIVITLNVRVDGENPHVAKEFAERLMKAMSLPTVAEQDAEQWETFGPKTRVARNGKRWQLRLNCEDGWTEGGGVAPRTVTAYRKGREVAEAENAAWEQVRALVEALFEVERGGEPPSHVTANSPDSDTLNTYAEIVQKVAEAEPWEYGYSDEPICFYCKAYNQHRDEATSKIVHAPNCLWLRARKLRGME